MKTKQRIIALLMTILLLGTNLLTLGNQVIAVNLAEQNSKTNHSNVTFDSYLEGETHAQTYKVGEEAKLYIKLAVKNTGYLKEPIISISDSANYVIDTSNLENEMIQIVTENQVKLKQIDSGKEVTIELPIKIKEQSQVDSDFIEKTSQVSLNGTYIDGNGKEVSIKKEVENKVIWQAEMELQLSSKVTKYIPYNQGEKSGVLVQTVISSNLKDHVLPISKTELTMQVPEMLGAKPQSVTVMANKTLSTNADQTGIDFTNANYEYNLESGLLTIAVENSADENGKIALNKDGVDEYIVNFIYEGEDLYKQALQEEFTSQMNVTGKVVLSNEEQTEISKIITVDYNEKEVKGNLVELSLQAPKTLNKGNIYANYDKKENKVETTYNASIKAQINYADLTDEVVMSTAKDYYLDENENRYPVSTGSYIKQISISQKLFEKILGTEGNIEINKLDGSNVGQINNTIEAVDGSYIIDISESNLENIQIKTSKPITVGNLELTLLKAINGDQEYSKEEMKTFKFMTLGLENEETVEQKVDFVEPVSKAEISISEQNLSTVVENQNVELRVLLDTSSTEYALFKNPQIQIELPEQIEKVNIKDANIILDDGQMEIVNQKVVSKNGKQVIQIDVKGLQTNYTETSNERSIGNEIGKGANIIINTDLTVNKFVTSSKENVVMYYTNENTDLFENGEEDQGKAIAPVNLVAPTGVSLINTMKGYSGEQSELMSLNGEKQEAIIKTHGPKQTVKIEGTFTNNYENSIENLMILGRIPFQGNKTIDGEDLGSTFTMPMTKKVTVDGIESNRVTVYYSTNGEATKDILTEGSNAWTTDIADLSTVRSYLIVITGEIAKETQFTFNYEVELPENLTTNNSAYQMYKAYYDNKTATATIGETKIAGTVGIVTQKSPELEVTLSSNIENNGTVRFGQIVKFFAEIKNIGTQAANDVVLNIPVPSNAIYTQYNSGKREYIDSESKNVQINVGTIEPGKTAKVDYDLKVQETLTMGEEDETISDMPLTHQVNVTAKDLTNPINSVNTYTLNMLESKLDIIIKIPMKNNANLSKGKTINGYIYITPKVDLKNVELTFSLPQGITIKSSEYEDHKSEKKDYIRVEKNQIKASIPEMNAGYLGQISFELEIDTFTGTLPIVAKATINGTDEHVSNYFSYNVGKVNLEIKQTSSTDKYIKEADEVNYEFEIKNSGSVDAQGFAFEDVLAQELRFKKMEYTYKGENTVAQSTLNNTVRIDLNSFAPNEILVVKITAQANLLPDEKQSKEVTNVGSISATGIETKTSNEIKNVIEYNPKLYEEDPNFSTSSYKISGTAWLDENRNGQREENEQLLTGINVILVKRSNGEIVKDIENGAEKTARTSDRGTYEFNNLEQGNYIVVFLYDASKYNITEYQKENISNSYNSDAISMLITLEGNNRIAGVTDTINLATGSARDIDIGLYEAEKFDLKLEKYISKITVTTPSRGTKVYNLNNSKLEKVEILKKDLNKSNIIIEYKIVVTNEGAVPGYVRKIADYLPINARFNSELNTDWYISNNNGTVYNTSLENTLLKPGEAKEVKLILSMQATSDTIGTIINNNAEIYESYNDQGLVDMDSTEANMLSSEDDMSNADIILSPGTGTVVLYFSLGIAILFILVISIIIIKRKVLDKTEEI